MPHQLRFNDAATTAEIEIAGGDRNALDGAGIISLRALFDEVLMHTSVRALIVTGAGDNFCGGRLRDMSLVTKAEIAADLEPILALNARMESYPLPVIAAVEGVAFGFGFGLSTLCDVTVIARDAKFALTELAHGLPPLIVLSYLFKFVPYKVGLDLALTGREIDANEAVRLGLATSIAPSGGALQTARAAADRLAAIDHEAVALLRRFAREQAALADAPAATRGADLIAELLASKAN